MARSSSHIEVVGSAPIERLDIYDGLDLIETVRPYGAGDLGARVRLVYEGAEYRGRARTTTWDGSLAVEGTKILRTAVINNWNLDRGIQAQDATHVTWKAVTTGNYGAIDLWLESATGRLAFKTAAGVRRGGHCRSSASTPRTFEAGGLERAVACSACRRRCARRAWPCAGASSCAPQATPASTSASSRRTATACGRARSICFAETAPTPRGPFEAIVYRATAC